MNFRYRFNKLETALSFFYYVLPNIISYYFLSKKFGFETTLYFYSAVLFSCIFLQFIMRTLFLLIRRTVILIRRTIKYKKY